MTHRSQRQRKIASSIVLQPTRGCGDACNRNLLFSTTPGNIEFPNIVIFVMRAKLFNQTDAGCGEHIVRSVLGNRWQQGDESTQGWAKRPPAFHSEGYMRSHALSVFTAYCKKATLRQRHPTK